VDYLPDRVWSSLADAAKRSPPRATRGWPVRLPTRRA